MKTNSPVSGMDPLLHKKLGMFTLIGTIGIVAAGFLVLAGWQFSIGFLIRPLSEVINPTMALVSILCGVALLLIRNENSSHQYILLGQGLSLFVIFIALLKLSESYHLHDFSVDNLMYSQKLKAYMEGAPVEKGEGLFRPNAAFSFLIIGVSLLSFPYKKAFFSQSLSFLATLIAVLALVGRLHNIPEFVLPLHNSLISIAGTICVLLLSVLTLVVGKDKGYMAEIMSPYSGGRIARRLIPLILFAPLILDVLRLYGENIGLYPESFGLVLFFSTILAISLFVILNSIKVANRIDLNLQAEVDERHKAEVEIRNNNLFLETVLENIPNMIFVKSGKDLSFVAINKAGEQLLGVNRKEYIGKKDDDLFPEDQAEFFKQKDWEGFKTGNIVTVEEEPVSTPSGQRWLRTQKIPVKDTEGQPLYLVGISEDITEAKLRQDEIKLFYAELEQKVKERTEELSKSEKRFRALIENSTDCITISNASTVIMYESPAVERMTGYLLEERAGKLLFDNVHPDDAHHCEELYDELLRNPGKPVFQQYRVRHKNGEYRWIEGTATNLLHDESVKATIFNYRDITERKQHEQVKEVLIQELTKHNADLRQFSYITSHNLRAPLSNLLGLLGLIDHDRIEDATLKEILEGFDTSTNSLNDTINDLLKILCIKENTGIEQEEIRLLELFQKVSSQVSNLIDEVDPAIEHNFTADAFINFNRAYLESIFLNLLTNAIKYRSDNRKLSLKVTMQEYESKTVVTFQDNGIGIDLEKCRSKVFGLYQRFHNYPDSKGLGLYLVKSQIEALGGNIEIESVVDTGTTFTLTFNKLYAEQNFFS